MPWSSGYGTRLAFKRMCVRIPAPETGWIFCTIYCCKNCTFCLTRPEKEAGDDHFCSDNILY